MICRHFGICGGCAYQDRPVTEYHAVKVAAVAAAFDRHGIAVAISEPVSVGAGSRRRATFKAAKTSSGVLLGFHAGKSHDIVDMIECPVLTPPLVRLVPGLRAMLADVLRPGETAELKLTDTPVGGDLSVRWSRKTDSALLTVLAIWAGKLGLARIAHHGETLVETEKPFVTLGAANVFIPSEAFLQPTAVGERALQDFVLSALAKSKKVIDLFCGCGTFSLPLAMRARVHAVELENSHLEALKLACRQPGFKPITVEKRNLFKVPVSVTELSTYDGLCLDPPRAGAVEQVRVLADPSLKIRKIAYVSCDAETFARDTAILVGAGWRLTRLMLLDQFLWSTHIELAAQFERRPL